MPNILRYRGPDLGPVGRQLLPRRFAGGFLDLVAQRHLLDRGVERGAAGDRDRIQLHRPGVELVVGAGILGTVPAQDRGQPVPAADLVARPVDVEPFAVACHGIVGRVAVQVPGRQARGQKPRPAVVIR